MNGIFAEGFSFARVNVWGLVLMAVAVIVIALARPVSKRWQEEKQLAVANAVRLAGLLICCLGAGVAILLG